MLVPDSFMIDRMGLAAYSCNQAFFIVLSYFFVKSILHEYFLLIKND